MGQRLFLSYSRQDAVTADAIQGALEAAGHEVWVDTEDIQGGDRWRASIVHAIEQAGAVVVLLSSSSVASDNVLAEIQIARDEHKRVIPVRLDGATPAGSLQYSLSGLQTIDYWSDKGAGLARLLAALDPSRAELSLPAPPGRSRGSSLVASGGRRGSLAWIVGGGLGLAIVVAIAVMILSDGPSTTTTAPEATPASTTGAPATTGTPVTGEAPPTSEDEDTTEPTENTDPQVEPPTVVVPGFVAGTVLDDYVSSESDLSALNVVERGERSDVPSGTILGVDPAPGSELAGGDTLTISVSEPLVRTYEFWRGSEDGDTELQRFLSETGAVLSFRDGNCGSALVRDNWTDDLSAVGILQPGVDLYQTSRPSAFVLSPGGNGLFGSCRDRLFIEFSTPVSSIAVTAPILDDASLVLIGNAEGDYEASDCGLLSCYSTIEPIRFEPDDEIQEQVLLASGVPAIRAVVVSKAGERDIRRLEVTTFHVAQDDEGAQEGFHLVLALFSITVSDTIDGAL